MCGYCDEDSGERLQDKCDTNPDCTARDGYDTCQWGYWIGCQNCPMYYNADARCQVDGTCSENSCGYNDGDDECDDGELFSDNTCLAVCSDDDDCKKRECYSSASATRATDCSGQGYVCDTSSDSNWLCFEGCTLFLLVQRDFGTL